MHELTPLQFFPNFRQKLKKCINQTLYIFPNFDQKLKKCMNQTLHTFPNFSKKFKKCIFSKFWPKNVKNRWTNIHVCFCLCVCNVKSANFPWSNIRSSEKIKWFLWQPLKNKTKQKKLTSNNKNNNKRIRMFWRETIAL